MASTERYMYEEKMPLKTLISSLIFRAFSMLNICAKGTASRQVNSTRNDAIWSCACFMQAQYLHLDIMPTQATVSGIRS